MSFLPTLAILCVLASCTTVIQGAQLERRYVRPVTAAASNPAGECPSETVRGELITTIRQEVRMHLQNITQNTTQQGQPADQCGGTSGWTRIVYLNMNDSSQTCPSGWVQAMFDGLRMCGRPSNASPRTCTQATFPTGGMEYRQVCGRALGYQYGDPVAFALSSGRSIDEYFMDGLTLTHGQTGSRQHIWSFANGLSEDRSRADACPCAPFASGITIPSFVGSNYFCESGIVVDDNINALFSFHNEPLWDGSGCSLPGNTCCTFNSPPYFSVQLPSPTTNNIDGRLCGYENLVDPGSSSAADTLITLLELYIK